MALPIVRGVRRWCFLPLPGVPKRSRINIEQHLPELLPRDKSTTGCAIPMRHDGKQYRQQVECSLFGHLQRMAPTVQGPMYIESPLTITAAYKDLSLTGVRYKPPEQLSAFSRCESRVNFVYQLVHSICILRARLLDEISEDVINRHHAGKSLFKVPVYPVEKSNIIRQITIVRTRNP